jgi:hypothetical protein
LLRINLHRFGNRWSARLSIAPVSGHEAGRMGAAHQELAAEHGATWSGGNYVRTEGRAMERVLGSDPRLTFSVAAFNGHLEIVDAETFRHALAAGIGMSKAYRFGLVPVGRV